MRTAVIGTGMMGERMAGRLLEAGFELTVYNRTAAKTAGLVARGARAAATPREAAEGAGILVTMVADPAAVTATATGDAGFLAGSRSGAVWLQMATISPAAVVDCAAEAARHGVRLVDAPVSGSLGAAARGLLVVLAGGAAKDIAAVRPVLDVLGRATIHLGGVGTGSAMKLALNAFLCAAMDVAAEAARLAESRGVDEALVRLAFEKSEIVPPWVLSKLSRLTAGDVRPAFSLALANKDLGLVAAMAAEAGVSLPLLDATRERYAEALAAGLGGQDFSAVDRVGRRA